MMRFIKASLLVLSIGMLVFTSCKPKEFTEEDENLYSNPTPPADVLAKMSCFVNEGTWSSKEYKVTLFNDVISIYAIGEKNDTISFNVLVNSSDMYYNFSTGSFNEAIYKNTTVDSIGYTSTLYFAPTVSAPNPAGFINFSDIDLNNNLISGTFAFRSSKSGLNKKTPITEGKFSNLKISPSEYENSLLATINATDEAVCSYTSAKRNINTKEIAITGIYDDTKVIGLHFNTDTISFGDTLIMDNNNYGIFNDGTLDYTSYNGKIIIEQFDTLNRTIKFKFNYDYNGSTVYNGTSNCHYLNFH